MYICLRGIDFAWIWPILCFFIIVSSNQTDFSGGTVDITVQEIKEDGDIKQIYMANGGDWGGVKVDQAIGEFLLDIFGMEIMDRFRNENKADYLSLCREFEVKKRGIRPDSTVKITLRLPLALTEKFQEVKGVSMKNSVKSNKSMSWVGDKLRVDPDTARDFYQESCKQIGNPCLYLLHR
jgi:hypothetical protein